MRGPRGPRETRDPRDMRDPRGPRNLYDGRDDRRGPRSDQRNDRPSYRSDRGPRRDPNENHASHRHGAPNNLSFTSKERTLGGAYGGDATTTRDPDADLSDPQRIQKYQKQLQQLMKFPTIEKIEVVDSKWGVKPKGFENVTAQRAKLSGLFPLPGYPRPVDYTKLEGLVKSRLNDANDVLIDSSHIDPIDSRNSSILIVNNVNFERVDYLRLVEYFNKFLSKIDIDETTVNNNIVSKRKTKDDKKLIVEFKNNTCATIILALNGEKVLLSSGLTYKAEENDENTSQTDQVSPSSEEEQVITLSIERPGEYVSQCLPPYKEMKLDEIEERVIDSPRKITILVTPESTETQIVDALRPIANIKGFQLLREIGTKQSLGIGFVEFYVDPQKKLNTIRALLEIQKFIEEARKIEFITDAFLSCITTKEEKKTSIQDCPIDSSTLKSLVKNEYASTHPKLKVIQLLNIVTAKDLAEESSFKFIHQDVLREMNTFGNVKSIKIPRPANDFTPGLIQFSQPGLGKVYVEFEEEEAALKAIMATAGRMYNDRVVLCAFFDHSDYQNGLL